MDSTVLAGDGAAVKWWGWGARDKGFRLEDHPGLVAYLKARLETGLQEESLPVSIDRISMPPARLDRHLLEGLRKIVGDSGWGADKLQRLVHSMGKSYRDTVRIRRGEVPLAPDAVVYPGSEEEVRRVLEWAGEHEIAVVPFGGGTSVVGGVEALGGPRHRGVVSLDARRLCRILAVDELSRTATIQAGILGPSLEEGLNRKGLTLGHFPQSFQYSTLGGWIATRSAGQQSTLYGKIEDLVLSLRMIHPGGVLDTLKVPARAAGPDWNQVVTGSEGIFGVISEATVRIRPVPVRKRYGGFFFRDFPKGVEACREFLQSGLVPATVRLSDAQETEFGMNLRPRSGNWKKQVVEHSGVWALEKLGYRPGRRCLMIVGFEGDEAATESAWKRARKICDDFGGFSLGGGPGRMWYQDRFEHPYLRDTLLDKRVLIDTLETAATWTNVTPLYEAVRQKLEEAIRGTGVPGIVMAHLSHCYATGSSLYFIFLARQTPGQELEQWWAIKEAASDCLLSHGGTISHHHGVGIDHARWAQQEHGPSAMRGLSGLKLSLDPGGIMNPGKILPLD
ncbi:MAG: FAD-binding oxidoreductase [bacterium]